MKTLFFSPPKQTAFRITTDSEQSVRALSLKYGQYLTEQPCTARHHITLLQSSGEFTIITKNGHLRTDSPLSDIDRYIVQNTVYDDSVLALHGAAVEWQEKCYLFLASTHCGKSTLTAYLTQNGFGYLTDDCILLDRTTFRIYPYTTPIQLRHGGLTVLQNYRSAPQNIQELNDGADIVRFTYTPSNCMCSPLPLAKIFFIERNERENALIEMSTTERITALMKSPIVNYQVTGDYIRFLSEIAKTACYRLRFQDLCYVKELIQNE